MQKKIKSNTIKNKNRLGMEGFKNNLLCFILLNHDKAFCFLPFIFSFDSKSATPLRITYSSFFDIKLLIFKRKRS